MLDGMRPSHFTHPRPFFPPPHVLKPGRPPTANNRHPKPRSKATMPQYSWEDTRSIMGEVQDLFACCEVRRA